MTRKAYVGRKYGMVAVMLVAMAVLFGSSPARADILFNADIENTTGNVANDYHVKMVAEQPITITQTYETGGDVVFDDALSGGNVQGNGTQNVTIDWEGATVNDGETTHIGAATAIGSGTPNGFEITESWWTFGGAKLVSARSGRLASAEFNGAAGSGDWVVVLVELYDDLDGTTLLGREWIEGRGTSAVITNQTSGASIFARIAYRPPGAMVPIEDLNEDLTGFGPLSSVIPLAPAGAGFPAVSTWGMVVLVLILLAGLTVKLARRQRDATLAS